jgi:hypothetical protein
MLLHRFFFPPMLLVMALRAVTALVGGEAGGEERTVDGVGGAGNEGAVAATTMVASVTGGEDVASALDLSGPRGLVEVAGAP